MNLDYSHIREQLNRIIHDYKDAEGYERGQSQNFWTQIFNAHGVSGQVQLKAFEHRLKNDKAQKYVDAFIPKLVMIEQKSRGLVERAADWEYSSFHHYVKDGFYSADWGESVIEFSADFIEGLEFRKSYLKDFPCKSNKAILCFDDFQVLKKQST